MTVRSSLTSAVPRRFAFVAGALALAAGALALAAGARAAPLSAQGAEILGRDDLAFARALYARGYSDLAEGVIAAKLAAGASAADELAAKALRLEVRRAAVEDERDLAARRDLLAKILEESEAFLQEHPGTPEAAYVEGNIQETTLLFGETIAGMLQEEQDPALFAELRKAGNESFSKAETGLRERIDALEEQLSDPEVEFEPLQQKSILASFDLARTLYFHSLLFAANDPSRDYYLTKAIDAFQDFSLDYGDQLLNYEGQIYQGLCQKTLGDNEAALAAFDGAIVLGTFELEGEVRDAAGNIVSSAVLQKVLLLTEMQAFDQVGAVVAEFRKAFPDPRKTSQGLAVLAAYAAAQIAAGDAAGAQKTAQELVDADPKGPWGLRGRELQGMAISDAPATTLDSSAMIRAAEALAVRGSFDRALEVCRRSIAAARVNPAEANAGVEAFMLMGSIYVRRGFMHEASMAFDAAIEEFPRAEKAPEALYRGLTSYLELYRSEANVHYKRAAEERKARLLADYGSSSFAARLKLVEGKELEAEGRFLDAAKLYEEVAQESPDRDEASFRAGNCYLIHGRNLQKAEQPVEAAQAFERAERLLTDAIAGLETAFDATLEREAQARLGGLAVAARMALVQLYLTPGLDRVKDVFPVLDAIDAKYAFDPDTISKAWGFRIQALEAQGKLAEAVAQLDILVKKDKTSRGIPPAAGVLARALDERAVKALTENAQSLEANDLWRQAATYYLLSVEPANDGNLVASPDVVESVAGRLFVMGLHFNRVPDTQQNFVGWDARKTIEPYYWERAAALYAKANALAPSYQTALKLGMTLGVLGRWADAARAYADVFDQEPLVDETTRRFRPEVVQERPDLVFAYLEWGIAEQQAGKADKDPARLSRAATIMERLAANMPAETPTWWQAKYHQIRGMIDRGDYQKADFFMNEIERSTNGFPKTDPPLEDEFLQMKAELKNKVPRAR